MQTLLSVATEFSGAFRDLQSGKLYSAAELLFWADGNQLAMEVLLVKQKPGVYLVRARYERPALPTPLPADPAAIPVVLLAHPGESGWLSQQRSTLAPASC